MRKETKEVYVAEDGKVFETEKECEKHEAYLEAEAKRAKDIRYFEVTHSPDLTEGRGHYGLTYIAIELRNMWVDHEAYVIDYCHNHFGSAVQFVQGVSPVIGWKIREITLGAFKEYPHARASVALTEYKAKVIFISNVGDYDYLPKHTPISICHKKA